MNHFNRLVVIKYPYCVLVKDIAGLVFLTVTHRDLSELRFAVHAVK